MSKVAPEWDDERTCITINKNLVCLPHKDPNNADYSYILFLGDYDGGELLFEDGTVISERYVWHKFDGRNLTHWNNPITRGTKYSVVIFNRNGMEMHRVKKTKKIVFSS